MTARTFFTIVLAIVTIGTVPVGVVSGVALAESRSEAAASPTTLETRAALTIGATATQIQPEYPRVVALAIANASTTCIACGGSDVTASTGILIGDGCVAGAYRAFDVASMFCVRVGGSDVTGVIVGYGAR